MNINLSIIDQQLTGISEQIEERAKSELGVVGDSLKSLSFVYLCAKTILDLEPDKAFECLTEGGGDFGVDAIHAQVLGDGDIAITLFQGKYKRKLDGESTFSENGIEKLTTACRYLFDTSVSLQSINPQLRAKVEDIRSCIRDGAMPRVRVIACNNGRKWNQSAQEIIDRFGNHDQISWQHVNHDILVNVLQKTKPVNDTICLSGKAIVEDMDYSQVCVGRVSVSEIARLMKAHGDRLLDRNIRSYLGLHGNRVNEDIRATLVSEKPSDFYFFNNGLTVICNNFFYDAFQTGNHRINMEDFQIVNGGQTCMTILRTFEELQSQQQHLPENAYVLIRIYKLNKDNQDTVSLITQATNSQNPVDLRDLRSNDKIQKQLGMSIKNFGYTYRRQRMETTLKPTDITTGTAAEAVLAVWRRAPHQAKFYNRDHFGKLYSSIFTESLNGAQVIMAVLLYRFAENRRRRPLPNDPSLVRYASCFLAMLMGRQMLLDLHIQHVDELDHKNFELAISLLDKNGNDYFVTSIEQIKKALVRLYGADWENSISMLQLSATFRRGDLISFLEP